MIHEHGGKNYTIALDPETLVLFGYIEIEDEELWNKGAFPKKGITLPIDFFIINIIRLIAKIRFIT